MGYTSDLVRNRNEIAQCPFVSMREFLAYLRPLTHQSPGSWGVSTTNKYETVSIKPVVKTFIARTTESVDAYFYFILYLMWWWNNNTHHLQEGRIQQRSIKWGLGLVTFSFERHDIARLTIPGCSYWLRGVVDRYGWMELVTLCLSLVGWRADT